LAFGVLDITVLVLVFGFLAAGWAHQPGMEVALPKTNQRLFVPNETLILSITGTLEPSFFLGPRQVRLQELRDELSQAREENIEMVVLRVDKQVPSQWALEVSELILEEGLRCGWLAESAEETR